MSAPIVIEFDLETISEANAREQHFARAKRVAREREVTTKELQGRGLDPELIVDSRPVVTMTRLATTVQSTDDDNLRGALKHVRDAIAAWLGVDDSPKGPVAWAYRQERRQGPNKKLGAVRIEISLRGAP